MKKYFITATDTDAGKTFVGCALVHLLQKHGRTLAFKPVSAGCENINGVLINEDARLLCEYANANQTIQQVNPIAFEEPIAPHIAASTQGKKISPEQITQLFKTLESEKADYIVTEGAGGWRLPLGEGRFMSEFVQQTDQKVILIVNMKLGCLNHAQLTYETIKADGLECIGWVANCIDTMPYLTENLNELRQLFDSPCLGVVEHCATVEDAAQQLSITQLIDA